MCGICLHLIFRSKADDEHVQLIEDAAFKDLSSKLKRRGPDDFQKLNVCYKHSIELSFFSSVLHLRSSVLESQPVRDDKGNILLWNGEIFGGPLAQSSLSDTKLLSEKLFCCTEIRDVLDVIGSIHGPYAFIFYQTCRELLWFGRDIFGRRSLLLSSDDTSFNLCSVTYGQGEWQEVPTMGLFCLDLAQSEEKKYFVTHHFPWSTTGSGSTALHKNGEVHISNLVIQADPEYLGNSPISKPLNRSLPSAETVDSYLKLLTNSVGFEKEDLTLLLEDIQFKNTVMDFEKVLSEAVGKRVKNQPYLCKDCYAVKCPIASSHICKHASVGILFSGGLDSIVIAALAHKHLPENIPIDLLNVAFASQTKLGGTNLKGHLAFDTPDRLTGKSGVSALRKICPSRSWNFIEVNVSEEELVFQRKNTISELLKPSCTVLDDSIGCAIWFAARAEGNVISEGCCTDYRSLVRVLLVGMGADEQLGGYSRHRAKFNNFGWSGLIDELCLELDRIGSRNLGRDDRIIADHSVESRYPFLDEDVVSFLNDLPVWLKMNLNLPRGLGEKLLLRLMAFKMGLTEAAVLPKRAIQFGSRIARIENTKEKGSDVCERLKQTL